jgi:threonine aldolase
MSPTKVIIHYHAPLTFQVLPLKLPIERNIADPLLTQLISLENTLKGTIFPQAEIVRIGDKARELGIKLHLDGARLWDVSAAVTII